MDDALARLATSALVACTPSVRLYSGANHSGSLLNVTAQYTFVNLSSHGFDNITSSYRIGGCNAGLYGGANGASPYPGNTSAGVSASSMLSGWDNAVSSVYIG